MKKIILIISFCLLPVLSWGSPFLVCDVPTQQVDKYIGTVDGNSFETIYTLHSSGVPIIYDLGTLDLTVPHTFGNIQACNVMGCSDPATTFVSPIKPNIAGGLRFIP